MNVSIPSNRPLTADEFLRPLMDHVIAATGLVYYAERSHEFAAHVARRLDASAAVDCRSYLRLLRSGQAGRQELDLLITLLTIGETHFFRHRELFDALEHRVLPNLIDQKRQYRRLRVWSAGCSTGAEAYSVSILLRRRSAAELRGWDVQILGTDINRDYLARAALGQFEDWALRAVSESERSECFSRCGKHWSLKPRFQAGVSFEYHNLATDPFPPPSSDSWGFDLILCRNVMIYFALEGVRKAIGNFYKSLAPGGWLVVGHAEHNVEWFRPFRTVLANGAVLYQKPPAGAAGFQASGDAPAVDFGALDRLDAKPAEFPMIAPPPSGIDAPVAEPWAPAVCPLPVSDGGLQEICALADQGDLEAALRCCTVGLTANNLDPLLHLYQGLLLHQVGEHQAAEQSLKRAMYLDRDCLLAHYYLGLLWQQQQEVTRAIGSFRNVAKLLSAKPSQERIPHADEMTVADLLGLTASHLAALEAR